MLFGYGVNRLSDNVYLMTGSSLFGLSKVWMAAALPASIFPIMVSYFNKNHEHAQLPGEKFHIYSIVVFLISLVILLKYFL